MNLLDTLCLQIGGCLEHGSLGEELWSWLVHLQGGFAEYDVYDARYPQSCYGQNHRPLTF